MTPPNDEQQLCVPVCGYGTVYHHASPRAGTAGTREAVSRSREVTGERLANSWLLQPAGGLGLAPPVAVESVCARFGLNDRTACGVLLVPKASHCSDPLIDYPGETGTLVLARGTS